MSDRGGPGPVRLDLVDTAELVEALGFLQDRFDDDDRGELSASLRRFTSGGYGLAELQADLARFAFLLGDDGERFFGAGGINEPLT